MASQKSGKCRNPSGSVYRPGEGLKVIPDIPNIDLCLRLILSHNQIGTLINGHCERCDFLDVSYNNLTEVTTKSMLGFPNVMQLRVNNNNISRIEGEVLERFKRVDMENNPLEYFAFDFVPPDTKLSLKNVVLPCDCEMKKAVERGVEFVTPPTCKHHPGIPYMEILKTVKCPQVEQVDVNRTPTSHSTTTGTQWWIQNFPEGGLIVEQNVNYCKFESVYL